MFVRADATERERKEVAVARKRIDWKQRELKVAKLMGETSYRRA